MESMSAFRQLIIDRLESNTYGIAPYGQTPDQIASIPALVAGAPSVSAGQDSAGVLLDVEAEIFVIGNGELGDAELVALADHVLFDLFGGARGVTLPEGASPADGDLLYSDTADARRLEVGGEIYPAYALTVTGTISRH